MKTNTAGEFIRSESSFRNWVMVDGRPGPSGEGGFQAGPGRYHLYVSLACPWAHRTLIFRTLKGLERAISVSVVSVVTVDDDPEVMTWIRPTRILTAPLEFSDSALCWISSSEFGAIR